jgi:Putative auto-transporter adhesin, head GIN domain
MLLVALLSQAFLLIIFFKERFMKKFLFAIFCIALVSSCKMITGNGNVRKEVRNTGTFTKVHSSGSAEVEITSGSDCAVTVEDDENLLPYLETNVENGTLTIHYQHGVSVSHDHAKIYITAPTLSEVATSGASDIKVSGVLRNSDKISFNTSGVGNIEGEVDAPAVSVTVSGAGAVRLRGRTKDFDCDISGVGHADCGNLESENTKVSISGVGNAHVFASVHLSATVSGTGSVYYRGNPQNPEIHTTGIGSVKAEN